jgi:two-component system, cell cycle response regulator
VSDRILIIDDSPEIQALAKVRLGKENYAVHCANDGVSGIVLARELRPDVILLDVDMPHRDGFSVCADLKMDPETRDIPVIFLSGVATTEDKIRGLDLGATDYISKPFDPAELLARVRSTLRTRYLVKLLAEKAMIDGLTGLWNRSYLDIRIAAELSAARRNETPLSCIMADVDNFKKLNDAYGHHFGDEVLREIACLFSGLCGDKGTVCRFGGEEFTVLLADMELPAAAALADRLRIAIEIRSFFVREQQVRITCSFGVADLGENPPPTILESADEALYNAKRAGRNRVEVSSSDAVLA